jgi:hypothetical protein
VFGRCEDNFTETNDLANCFADNRKGLLNDFSIREDVVRIPDIQLVDIFFGTNSSISIVRFLSITTASSSSDSSSMYSFLPHLIAFDGVVGLDFVAGLGIDLLVFDAIARRAAGVGSRAAAGTAAGNSASRHRR